jgi:CRISPR/Cas system-associated exonuclease Cas4 (RecB family)
MGMLAPENEGTAAHESGESCLFYVGVTRAREHLVLSYGERYGKMAYKKSRYLDALETGLPAERITRLRWDRHSISPLAGLDEAEDEGEAGELSVSSQPGLNFINAMRSPGLSSSAIEAYQRCPRQYAYNSIYHFAQDTTTYQIFWTATQKTLEDLRHHYHNTTDEQGRPRLPDRQEIQERYAHHWQEAGGGDAMFAQLYEEHGYEVVEAIRRNLLTQDDLKWDLRSNFQVEVEGTPVHVTVDRVEASYQAEQPVRFVRARFGGRKDKPAAETRELFYALAYRQHHPGQNLELHVHNMSTGEMMPLKLTDKKERSLYDGVSKAIQGLQQNQYPARPEQPRMCPTCPFFLICPA